jgi:hypothetical protein
MAKQQIKNHQYKVKKDSTQYVKPFFKYGVVSKAFGGETDATIDTGVAKFPNGLLASGVAAGWPNASWSQETRGMTAPSNGSTNIDFQVHYAGPAQTVDYKWWAIGY